MRHPNQSAKNDLLYKIYAEQIARFASLIHGNVLDLGCGDKPYASLFYLTEKSRYIGIDIIKGQSDVIASGEYLPFQDEVFDSAVCLQTLEHVREPKALLNEAYRVLKPGGVLLLTTPFMWGVHSEPYDYFRYTPYGIEYLAKQAGFIAERVIADTGFWLLMALRLNYYLSRLNTSLFNLIFWLTQRLGHFLDSLDVRYRHRDTAGYTTVLRKVNGTKIVS